MIVVVEVVDGPTFGWDEGSRHREMSVGHVAREDMRRRSVVGVAGRGGWQMALSHGQAIGREGFEDEEVVGESRRLEATSFERLDVGALTVDLY